jgi:maleate cis-trans isomerase
MYAWRARIGLINPTHRGKAFAFWYKRVPEGVEIIPTFIGFRSSDRDTFEQGFKRAEELAADLKSAGCDVISVSGTPPVLLKGLDFEREWRDRLAQKLGIPVVTQMEPHALALQALGIRRVGVATYYGSELNDAIVRYFRRFDIEGISFGGYRLGGREEALYTTSLPALDEVGGEQVYRYCRAGFLKLASSVDGIYINGGGWDAVPAVNLLEQDLSTKVVLAQAAELWLVLQTLSINVPIADCGTLLRDDHPPLAAFACRPRESGDP